MRKIRLLILPVFALWCTGVRRKKTFIIVLAAISLSGCRGEESLPDLSKMSAIYSVLNKKTFVISEITNDNGQNLLNELYGCAKDDTFCIKPFDGEGEIPIGMVLTLTINLGDDWCNQGDAQERTGWQVTQGRNEYYFKYALPPNYKFMNFSTKPESPNQYTPDEFGNFSLSTLDSSDIRTYFHFRKVEEHP